MIKTIIIEDEKAAAQRMERLLSDADSEIKVIEILDSITSSVRWLSANPAPDLIILDIQLSDGLSFEIFKQIKIESFIIFTTAFDEYAIKAFELNSIDYLLKPIQKNKLAQSILKYKKLKPIDSSFDINPILEAISNQKTYKKRFLVNTGSKMISININDIAYFY